MKFDVVVGNPPYQENDNGKRAKGSAVNASASPLYHYFFELAKNISNEKLNLIFPARWLAGAGKGLGSFSTDMLNDTSVKSLTLFKDSAKVFPGTAIKGGVLFLTYDKKYSGKASVNVIDIDGTSNKLETKLNSANSGVFIPFGEMVSVFEKINKQIDLSENNVQKIVSGRKPFGLATDFFKSPKKYNLPSVHNEQQDDSDIEIIGLLDMKRTSKFVPDDYPLSSGNDLIDKWKVFVPYAYGSGKFGELGPNLILGKPKQISTETFMVIGPFETEYEAKAMIKYFKTKFFRALIGILKTTQHSTTTYGFVPLENFTKSNEYIDWDMSIDELDLRLFNRYNLSDEEISFIIKNVKSMS